MSTIINSTTLGVVLSDPLTQNPATVASGAYVTNVTTQHNGEAIYGSGAAAWYVVNSGTVVGNKNDDVSTGIALTGGGTIRNAPGGRIAGVLNGAYIFGSAGTVRNFSTIEGTGTSSNGVLLSAGGSVQNGQGDLITGGLRGVALRSAAAGAVTNFGTIRSTGTSV